MAIIGFIVLVLICIVLTFLLFVIPLASGVGGVPAKRPEIVGWFAFAAFVIYAWYYVLSNSPFSYTGF